MADPIQSVLVEPKSLLMVRIKEGDVLYMAWWMLLIGVIIFFLARIERNTRWIRLIYSELGEPNSSPL